MNEESDRLILRPAPLPCTHLTAAPDGTSVVLSYRHDDSQRMTKIDIQESTDEVRITVWVEWRPDAAGRAGASHVTRRTLRLPTPLAGRRLVDGGRL